MTRPSEAEVTEALAMMLYTADRPSQLGELAALVGVEFTMMDQYRSALRIAAALSTPRPSEAEVIAKVTEAFVVELRAEWADAGCKTPMQVDGGCDCPDCVLANTVCAALDLVIQHRATPPLAPEVTAEKVALIEALRDAMKVGVPEGSNATEAIRWLTAALSTPPLPSAEPVHEGDGLTWTEFRNHVARVLADAGQHGLRVAFLRRCFTDTTPPAAAQDTARLDWLESSHGDARYMWARRWEVIVKRDNKHTLDAAHTLRAAIDKSMGAARAAGGE